MRWLNVQHCQYIELARDWIENKTVTGKSNSSTSTRTIDFDQTIQLRAIDETAFIKQNPDSEKMASTSSSESEWESESGDEITESDEDSSYVSECSEIFYPVLSLPVELTIMIFEAACIESRSSPSTNTEVIISHVCHSWRSISLSCPQLWSTFKHDGWTLEKPIQQSQVNAYIKRSQNQLLDFAFEVDDSMGLFTVAQNDIVPNISRFRRLALCISSQAEFVVALLELFEFLHMDNLEIFELHLREDADWPSEIEEVEAFFFKGEAPRLKAIRTISRFLWLFHAAKALEHSTDITDFQLDAIPPFLTGWNDFSSFFVNASTLTTLSLSGHIFRARSPNDVQTVYFPSLKYFRCRDDAVAQSISRFLRAPLLEQLILQNLDIGSWAKTSGRAAPPIDVFPRIKVVAFMNCNIYNSKNSPLSALAQATCSATHIMVSHDNVLQLPAKGGIIKYLVRHGRKPVLWENMEVLSSFDQFMSKERYSCYLDMMKYRVENVLNGKVGKLRILERHAKQHRGSVANEGIVEAV